MVSSFNRMWLVLTFGSNQYTHWTVHVTLKLDKFNFFDASVKIMSMTILFATFFQRFTNWHFYAKVCASAKLLSLQPLRIKWRDTVVSYLPPIFRFSLDAGDRSAWFAANGRRFKQALALTRGKFTETRIYVYSPRFYEIIFQTLTDTASTIARIII